MSTRAGDMYCTNRCCSASRCAEILNGSRAGFRFANARFKMDRVVVRRTDVCADIRRPDVQFLTIPAGAGQFDMHATLGVEPRTAPPTSPYPQLPSALSEHVQKNA